MSAYLIVNIIIVIVPFLFSFEKNLNFRKKIPTVLKVCFINALFFVTWDISSTVSGIWIFNEEYTLGINIYSLPIEEILFFITVPYSMLFIYETINFYIKEKSIKLNYYLIIPAILLFAYFSFVSYDYIYSFTIFSLTALFFIINTIFPQHIFGSRNYWIFASLSIVPFLIFDYILTSIPIISYDPESITGIKLLTIPVEDLFYNYVLNSILVVLYKKLDAGKK